LDGDFVRPGGTVGLPCRGVLVGVTAGSVGVGVLTGVGVGFEVGVVVGVGCTVGEDEGSVRTATGVTSSAGLVDSDVSDFGRSSSVGVSRELGTGVGGTFGR
jgi:hypothetical protein